MVLLGSLGTATRWVIQSLRNYNSLAITGWRLLQQVGITVPLSQVWTNGILVLEIFNIKLEKGLLYTWGSGKYGRLGIGNETDSYSPVCVSSLMGKKVVGVALGERHSAAVIGIFFFSFVPSCSFWLVSDTGELYTWGDASFGVLGHGELKERVSSLQLEPRLVQHLTATKKRVVKVACGGYHTLALTADLLVFAWGDEGSHGILGQGNHDEGSVEATPLLVAFLQGKNVVSISVGLTHSAALTG